MAYMAVNIWIYVQLNISKQPGCGLVSIEIWHTNINKHFMTCHEYNRIHHETGRGEGGEASFHIFAKISTTHKSWG